MTKSRAGASDSSSTKISFLQAANASNGWLDLEVNVPADASEEVVRKAELDSQALRKQLDEYLHSMLMTPNLVVLTGSGTSLGRVGGPSMQDLWKGAIEISDYSEVAAIVKQPADDEWVENLLSRCKMAQNFIDDAKMKKVAKFLIAAEKMILEKCSNFLGKADLAGHRTFLKRMARRRLRAPRLKLFTINYDLCFETAASDLGITLIDGFSFANPRRFDPRFFNYDIVRRSRSRDEIHDFVEGVMQIMKLHGSVNWDNTPQGVIQNAVPKTPCLIYPACGKYEQSYSQPHLELMAQFQWILRESNTCLVMIGFGCNDNHLTAPILAAVDSNPSFKLLVVDCCARAKSECAGAAYYQLRQKISAGEADVFLLNADFEQFSNLIPHLRALSPAEQIEQSINKIVQKS